jgi:hypothetical protein
MVFLSVSKALLLSFSVRIFLKLVTSLSVRTCIVGFTPPSKAVMVFA